MSARREVRVRPSAVTTVELDLAPAGMLRVRVADARGPLSAVVRVFGPDGVELSDLAVGQADAGAFGAPTRTSERSFGPLAPDRYEVHVRALDGRAAREVVRVGRGSETLLDIALRE